MQRAANQNWEEVIGMDVPARRRDAEDPEHRKRMPEETHSIPLNRCGGA